VCANSDTSADHLATSSDERHRPIPIPIPILYLANLDHDPNHGHGHDPSRRDHRDRGLDRLRPVCWSLP
jgi:hypothetical protein